MLLLLLAASDRLLALASPPTLKGLTLALAIALADTLLLLLLLPLLQLPSLLDRATLAAPPKRAKAPCASAAMTTRTLHAHVLRPQTFAS